MVPTLAQLTEVNAAVHFSLFAAALLHSIDDAEEEGEEWRVGVVHSVQALREFFQETEKWREVKQTLPFTETRTFT